MCAYAYIEKNKKKADRSSSLRQLDSEKVLDRLNVVIIWFQIFKAARSRYIVWLLTIQLFDEL